VPIPGESHKYIRSQKQENRSHNYQLILQIKMKNII